MKAHTLLAAVLLAGCVPGIRPVPELGKEGYFVIQQNNTDKLILYCPDQTGRKPEEFLPCGVTWRAEWMRDEWSEKGSMKGVKKAPTPSTEVTLDPKKCGAIFCPEEKTK